MNLNEYEKCPKCGCVGTVFCCHRYSNNQYNIHCYNCGATSEWCDTYKKARKAWEKLKNDDRDI